MTRGPLALLWIVVLLAGLGAMPAAGEAEHRVEVLVGFHEAVEPEDRREVERAGGEIRRELTAIPTVVAEVPERAVDGLARSHRVRYVEPNVELRALGVASSGGTAEPTGTLEAAEELQLPWGIEHIGVPGAWSELGVDPAEAGEGVTVAVLDSGITHSEVPVAWCTDIADSAEGDCHDAFAHGTHVAGTIAASHNSQTPGAAPGVSLHDVKVLGDDGRGSTADIAEGILVAAEPGTDSGAEPADVINLSLGGGGSQTLQDAVETAWNDGDGPVIVAAAGNGGNPGGNNDTVSYPAAYDEVVAVGAVDENNQRATFSSTGPAVELMAPGVDVPSTWPGDGYHEGNGTSMASPHVAASAALLHAADVGLDAAGIRDLLGETAEQIGRAQEYGQGLVRIDTATQAALAEDDQDDEPLDLRVEVSAPEEVEKGTTAPVTATVHNDGDETAKQLELTLTVAANNDEVHEEEATIDNLEADGSSTVEFEWDTDGVEPDEYTATGTLHLDEDEVDADTTTISVADPDADEPEAEMVTVSDVDCATQGRWDLQARIRVVEVDGDGEPTTTGVEDAAVTATIDGTNDDYSDQGEATTDDEGWATIRFRHALRNSDSEQFLLVVDNVAIDGDTTWDDGQPEETLCP